MKWLGTKTIRFESLKLPGDWKKRLGAKHVKELAESITSLASEPINLPVVWYVDSDSKAKPRELTAGGDRAAALFLNGAKVLEVRAFEGTADDARRVRAHENAHRRHDDRDAWLRSLVDGDAKPEVGDYEFGPGDTDTSASPLGVAHAANDDGYPACGAPLGGGDSTVGQLVDALITCPADACKEADKRNKLLRLADAKSPQTAKSEARKKVAEVVGTTPAAVKQAEYRDRKAKGEVKARKVHDDGAPAMSEAAQKLVADIAAIALALQHQQAAMGRLMERNPSLQMRFNAGHAVETIKAAAADIRAMTPVAVCCYCIDNATEDCHACKNDRFLTKAQLRDAPEEMRKRVA